MSIEYSLASIAKSLESIAKSLEHSENYPASSTPVTPVAVQQVQAPVALSPAVVIEEIPLPMFAAPVVAPVVAPAPFNDAKGLITYVMDSYKTLGPVNGARIQEVLTACGYANINEVKPEAYGALYAGVEALKS